jgi:hypothetical protein
MTTRNPTILDAPEDWQTWIEEIEGSTPNAIWKLIDPDLATHEVFRTMPIEPNVRDVQRNKTSYAQLGIAERPIYDNMFKHYQLAITLYEREVKAHQEAKDLIRSRVSEGKSQLLKGKETAREWLKTLKTATTVSDAFLSRQTAHKYATAISKYPTVASITKWLANWEVAMANARRHNIPEISAGRWLTDLAAAIRPLSDPLRTTFVLEASDDDKNNSKNYLEVSTRIREVIGTSETKRRVVRGAANAGDFDEEDVDEADDSNIDDKDKKQRKRAGTTSSIKGKTKSKKQKVSCKGCGQYRHELKRCYYAFPELRYRGFKPVKEVEEKFAKALSDNKNLVDEIDAIRKALEDEKHK